MLYLIATTLVLVLLLIAAKSRRIDVLLLFLAIAATVLFIVRYPIWMPAVAILLTSVVLLASYVSIFIYGDLKFALKSLSALRMVKLTFWALALVAPFALVAWATVYLGDLQERFVYYDCRADGTQYLHPVKKIQDAEPVYSGIEREKGEIFFAYSGDPALATESSSFRILVWLSDHVPSHPCPAPSQLVNHEESAILTVNWYVGKAEKTLLGRVNSAVNAAEAQGLQAEEAVSSALFGGSETNCTGANSIGTEALPATLRCVIPMPARCKWYHWISRTGDCIERMVKEPFHLGYESRRASFKNSFAEKLNELQDMGSDTGEATHQFAQAFVTSELLRIEEQSVRSIERSFFVWRVLEWVGLIILILAIFKAFLYVLGRLIFSPEAGGVSLNLAKRACPQNGTQGASNQSNEALSATTNLSEGRILENCKVISSKNRTINVSLDDQKWYAARSSGLSWEDHQKVNWMPRPTQMLLRRIRHRKVSFYVYRPTEQLTHLKGAHEKDLKVASIKLSPEDELIIDLSRLVGFSEGISFKTVFSPLLSSFLQHRLFFTVAYGSGTILLSGAGGTVWGAAKTDEREAVPPEDIIAMDKFGTFGCRAQVDFMSVYTQPFTIQANSKSLMLSHRPRMSRSRTLLRKLKKVAFFILPF